VNTKDKTALCAATIRLLAPSKSSQGCRFLFVAGVFLLSVIPGCASRESIESARSRGVEAGHDDGQRAGEAAGFQIGFKEAENSSYTDTVSQLCSSGDYHRPSFYCLAVLVAAFLLGYALQYSVLYLLRRLGFLADIDWIVLSSEAIENLRSVSEQKGQAFLTEEPTKLLSSNAIYGQGSG
jgi:hypothetical protein